MNAPREPAAPEPSSIDPAPVREAVVVDQLALFRVGVSAVLEALDVHVAASLGRVSDALRTVRGGSADLLIVGRAPDLKPQHALKDIKRAGSTCRVVFLTEQVTAADVARLLTLGVDGILLRGAEPDELGTVVSRLRAGERYIAPAVAAGTLGRVGPVPSAVGRGGLSAKELEVLGELATGQTYRQIASSLVVTQATVKTHLVHVYAKLGVSSRQEAVARALALGLLA